MIVIVVLAVSAALGDVLLDPASGRIGAFAPGFAAGAVLVMVTDTMLSEAYDVDQIWERGVRDDRDRDLIDAVGDLRAACDRRQRRVDPGTRVARICEHRTVW